MEDTIWERCVSPYVLQFILSQGNHSPLSAPPNRLLCTSTSDSFYLSFSMNMYFPPSPTLSVSLSFSLSLFMTPLLYIPPFFLFFSLFLSLILSLILFLHVFLLRIMVMVAMRTPLLRRMLWTAVKGLVRFHLTSNLLYHPIVVFHFAISSQLCRISMIWIIWHALLSRKLLSQHHLPWINYIQLIHGIFFRTVRWPWLMSCLWDSETVSRTHQQHLKRLPCRYSYDTDLLLCRTSSSFLP